MSKFLLIFLSIFLINNSLRSMDLSKAEIRECIEIIANILRPPQIPEDEQLVSQEEQKLTLDIIKDVSGYDDANQHNVPKPEEYEK